MNIFIAIGGGWIVIAVVSFVYLCTEVVGLTRERGQKHAATGDECGQLHVKVNGGVGKPSRSAVFEIGKDDLSPDAGRRCPGGDSFLA